MNTKLWVYFAQQVYMIGHHFQLDDGSLKFLSRLVEYLFQEHIHAVDQQLATIFGTPNLMIFA